MKANAMTSTSTDQNQAVKRQSHVATFAKVLDGRKQPIRGLWVRNGRYYAQLTIEDSKTGNILWSDLIEARGTDSTPKLNWWEMTLRYGPGVLAGKWYVLVPLLGFAGLIVLLVFFRLMRRAR